MASTGQKRTAEMLLSFLSGAGQGFTSTYAKGKLAKGDSVAKFGYDPFTGKYVDEEEPLNKPAPGTNIRANTGDQTRLRTDPSYHGPESGWQGWEGLPPTRKSQMQAQDREDVFAPGGGGGAPQRPFPGSTSGTYTDTSSGSSFRKRDNFERLYPKPPEPKKEWGYYRWKTGMDRLDDWYKQRIQYEGRGLNDEYMRTMIDLNKRKLMGDSNKTWPVFYSDIRKSWYTFSGRTPDKQIPETVNREAGKIEGFALILQKIINDKGYQAGREKFIPLREDLLDSKAGMRGALFDLMARTYGYQDSLIGSAQMQIEGSTPLRVKAGTDLSNMRRWVNFLTAPDFGPLISYRKSINSQVESGGPAPSSETGNSQALGPEYVEQFMRGGSYQDFRGMADSLRKAQTPGIPRVVDQRIPTKESGEHQIDVKFSKTMRNVMYTLRKWENAKTTGYQALFTNDEISDIYDLAKSGVYNKNEAASLEQWAEMIMKYRQEMDKGGRDPLNYVPDPYGFDRDQLEGHDQNAYIEKYYKELGFPNK